MLGRCLLQKECQNLLINWENSVLLNIHAKSVSYVFMDKRK